MNCEICSQEVRILHQTILGGICFDCFQNKEYRKGLKTISIRVFNRKNKEPKHLNI